MSPGTDKLYLGNTATGNPFPEQSDSGYFSPLIPRIVSAEDRVKKIAVWRASSFPG
jgi:hypothetical protein